MISVCLAYCAGQWNVDNAEDSGDTLEKLQLAENNLESMKGTPGGHLRDYSETFSYLVLSANLN